MFVVSWRFWSLMSGSQTPERSGSACAREAAAPRIAETAPAIASVFSNVLIAMRPSTRCRGQHRLCKCERKVVGHTRASKLREPIVPVEFLQWCSHLARLDGPNWERFHRHDDASPVLAAHIGEFGKVCLRSGAPGMVFHQGGQRRLAFRGCSI